MLRELAKLLFGILYMVCAVWVIFHWRQYFRSLAYFVFSHINPVLQHVVGLFQLAYKEAMANVELEEFLFRIPLMIIIFRIANDLVDLLD